MPTMLSHPAVPLALGIGLSQRIISKRLLAAGCVASVLPDLDVVAFCFGIPYASGFGHRGFSHSILFALLTALAGACCYGAFKTTFSKAFPFLFIATVSHGLLDAFTNGGLGVDFFWPFSTGRYFFPVKFIEVSPLAAARFFSRRGAKVLFSELLWVWVPFIFVGISTALLRKQLEENLKIHLGRK